MRSFWFGFLSLHHFAVFEFLWVVHGVQLSNKEESRALLAPYEKIKAWTVVVEGFTTPYFVEVCSELEKLAKILEKKMQE